MEKQNSQLEHEQPMEQSRSLPLLSVGCLVTVNVLWLFLTVPWVGLQCVIVVFPDRTHFLLKQHQCIL